ncbi:hypothetical protein T484DRAFT_1755268 [Baffinella frigidus]|nr:hypothetical protein T484DRAFT_1755268 [Cryptophyta sp. CCMP2293]
METMSMDDDTTSTEMEEEETMSMDDDTTSTEMEEEETEDCGDDAKKEKKKSTKQKHKCNYPDCNASRRCPNELRRHVDFAHNLIFHNVCHHIIDEENGTTCGYKCERPGDMEKHKQNNHNSAHPFKCTDCPKAFESAGGLEKHKRSKHDDARLYKCKDCPEIFKHTGARDSHWNAVCSPIGHPGRTKFKCKCAPKDDPEREAFLERKRKAVNALYAGSELVRIKKALRSALHRVLKKMGVGKISPSEEMLGCTYEQLIAHLNDNDRGLVYGDLNMVLHIDHIRPMASFKDIGCRVGMHECANFNNLQLLPGSENLRKGASFTPAEEAAYALTKGYRAIAELRKVWRAAGVCSCELCEVCQ